MNNDEKILAMLESLSEDVKGIKADVNGMKADVNGMKADVNGIKSDVNGMKADFNGIKDDVNGVKATVQENCDMIKAMTHRLETLDAKMDGLQNTTASLKQMQDFKRNMSEKLRELANGIMP